jgi:hypothetical protein
MTDVLRVLQGCVNESERSCCPVLRRLMRKTSVRCVSWRERSQGLKEPEVEDVACGWLGFCAVLAENFCIEQSLRKPIQTPDSSPSEDTPATLYRTIQYGPPLQAIGTTGGSEMSVSGA